MNGEDKQKVMVIDGGKKESRQELVEHINKYYKTDYVHYVVNTSTSRSYIRID